jgi:endonuclease YncB( thermonuclease family)
MATTFGYITRQESVGNGSGEYRASQNVRLCVIFTWDRAHDIMTSIELVDQTIHIRMAGIDAPERPNFGRSGQPYADDAMAWLKSKIEGRTVYCQLVLRDQYQRIVSALLKRVYRSKHKH